jgi:hypothetical protein
VVLAVPAAVRRRPGTTLRGRDHRAPRRASCVTSKLLQKFIVAAIGADARGRIQCTVAVDGAR